VASTAVGSIVPSISLTERPACAASKFSMYSIMPSICWSDRFLIKHGEKAIAKVRREQPGVYLRCLTPAYPARAQGRAKGLLEGLTMAGQDPSRHTEDPPVQIGRRAIS